MSIRLEEINYTYGAGTAYEIHALKNVSLEIQNGEFVGIIGHTGSGKSTLIQMLDGLIRADSGHIYFENEDIYADGFSMRSLRGKIGLVFQYPEYQLFETTVLKDVAFGPGNQGLSESDALERAKEALRRVKMPEKYWEMSPFELSGGQKRRAAIAGVIAMEPQVLILDEPTAGLDPRGRDELFAMICELHENTGMTVLLVSHSMEDVADYVSRIVVMDHGSVMLDGTPAEVFSHVEELEAASLAVPQVTYLMRDLQAAGFDVNTSVTTLAEAKKEILKLC
ncbi:MAG: energy-coupling factor transporter ATPase [Lachnospiraceae bacterium]|nr:energy-coupling factor transporter ATPase [Lachnospiraceae bacterium]